MTVNAKLIAALKPLGYPVVPDLYTGDETTYLTFNDGARGALFADDAPSYDIRMVQVHLMAPCGVNTVAIRKRIKRALFDAGFTWPEETDAGRESRAEARVWQHIVFECQIEEGVEDG